MRKLTPIFLMILMTACTVPPKQVPKNEIERALSGKRPILQTEIETPKPEKSHYQVIERGRSTRASQIASKSLVGEKKGPTHAAKKVKEAFPLLNLEDASLWEVIKIVADYRHWNYVIDPAVPDKGINIRLNTMVQGMGVENILHLLLSIYDVAMVNRGGMVYFVPTKGADYKLGAPIYVGNKVGLDQTGEGWVTQVIPLHFVSPKDLSPILKEFISTGGKIVEDPVTSTVVIVDRLPYVRKIMNIISLFDVNIFKNKKMVLIRFQNADAEKVTKNITEIFKGYGALSEDKYYIASIKELNALLCVTSLQEVVDEVKFWSDKFEKESEVGEAQIFIYHAENSKAVDLVNIIKELYAEEHTATKDSKGKMELRPVLKGDFKVITDENNNSLIFKTTRRDYDIIEKTLKQLDAPKRQVLIEAMILDVSLSGSLSYGFNFFLQHLQADANHAGQFTFSPGADAGAFTGAYTFLSRQFQIDAVLNMNEVRSRTNVLSTPHIMVLDNESASIDVGEQISIQSGNIAVPGVTGGTSGGVYNSTSYQYLSTGVKLQVKPSISSNGNVRMEITQSYSVPGTATGSGNPPIKNRSAQTVVNVPDGQSLIIGGMIQQSQTNSDNSVPLLSKIPLIKYLFANKSQSRSKSELIIIITPHVIYNHKDAKKITDEFRKEIDKFRMEIYGKLKE
ncbi:MAG: type II secretion system secretin GspD [Acidobacteria bacterium]|nr:type II secretion system secretin GspD [Acidobacteriota bacterium]